MSWFKLLVAEITFRPGNFAASVLAVTVACALFIAGPALLRNYGEESKRQIEAMNAETDLQLAAMQEKSDLDIKQMDKRTKRIMRDLGFNLRIVHANTDMTDLLASEEAFPMPESHIQKLADAPEITKIVHLVASLRKMIRWEEKPRLLVGFAPEATQSHIEKKAPMGFEIQPGEVYLGHLVAGDRRVGDEVEILGNKLKVVRILPPYGTRDRDIMIAVHLKDAQKMLQMEDQITEILALGCKCKTVERVEEITAQLELVLADTKVTEMRTKAIAREDQRNLITSYHKQSMASFEKQRAEIVDEEVARRSQIFQSLQWTINIISPLAILVGAIWVGSLAWSNVKNRRNEIGLLRALGKRANTIGAIFLGKAMLVGLIGGLLGAAIGIGLGYGLSSQTLGLDSTWIVHPWGLAGLAVLGAPILAAMASYLPTLAAVRQDPSIVLMDA